MDSLTILTWVFPFAFVGGYVFWYYRRVRKNVELLEENTKAGLMEPSSLHPLIDPLLCIGCGSCVSACPEAKKKVLGLVKYKSVLINPTHCIGHGACKTACPENAITLVFGTEKRGMDIPEISENFETNVPGLFIAGELGGMGLIRNAVTQGKQAIDAIQKLYGGQTPAGGIDVLIVGTGPSGFAATLAAQEKGLKYTTVEQDSLGGTVFAYPRGKLVMTAPVVMPIVGPINMCETSKEKLLEVWQGIEKKTGVKINYLERMEDIVQEKDGFVVQTNKGEYRTRAVLLSIGRRGTPRKLNVEGDDQPKVVYRLIDPEQYRDQKVLVVGGGDSALEAATSLVGVASDVTISYRSKAFSRAKEKNRNHVDELESSGDLRVLMESNVSKIGADDVDIKQGEEIVNLANDIVIVNAGGILPTPFLKKIGINVETKHGTM
ncbi:MAG TPA: 4Fe-4S dicluster domain-containing protein [Gammaproteobacteria bacterium]|nr:4Fe-4S dicluster domain-containing protein [Gammaproteobacteria bacterium]